MVDPTHPVVRERTMREMSAAAGEIDDDYPSLVLLEAAERDLAAAEEDLTDAQQDYRDAVADRTTTRDGRDRTPSAEGEREISQAARRVANLAELETNCRGYRDRLLTEQAEAIKPLPPRDYLDD